MSIKYFNTPLGIIHLIRFICLICLIIFSEIKFPTCSSNLNEYLGFNYYSIVFYYILIWISFSFEIYFLINRLFGTDAIQAIKSIIILYTILSVGFLHASGFTLYAFIYLTPGYLITQHDLSANNNRILNITQNCNILRLVGILFGLLISLLYLTAVILMYGLLKKK